MLVPHIMVPHHISSEGSELEGRSSRPHHTASSELAEMALSRSLKTQSSLTSVVFERVPVKNVLSLRHSCGFRLAEEFSFVSEGPLKPLPLPPLSDGFT